MDVILAFLNDDEDDVSVFTGTHFITLDFRSEKIHVYDQMQVVTAKFNSTHGKRYRRSYKISSGEKYTAIDFDVTINEFIKHMVDRVYIHDGRDLSYQWVWCNWGNF